MTAPTILIVHDAQEGPEARSEFLQLAGYNTVLCGSSIEALRGCDDTLPDLLITDVLIEGQNGFDLVAALRARFDAEQLPILMCLGIYRSRAYQDDAFGRGAQAILAGPTTLDELCREVRELIGGGDETEGESSLEDAA